MSWSKLDDALHGHPKVLAAGLEAMGLWVRALSYSAHYLTDGRVTAEAAASIAGSRAALLAAKLVASGLWEPDPSGDGWCIHDYLEFNPSRAQVLAERAAKREGGQRGARNRWNKANGSTHDSSHGSTHAVSHGATHASPIGIGDAPDPDPDPDPDPVPIPRENPPAPPSFGLTAPEERRATVRKAKGPVPGHTEVIAAYSVEYEKLRGCKPEIAAKERAAANRLLLSGRRPVAEALAIVRRAFADDFVCTKKPDLAYIAANVNAFIGTAPAQRNGKPPVQPAPADGEPTWRVGLAQ